MTARLTLDPGKPRHPLPKLMADIGFDEIRALLDPTGRRVFELVGASNAAAPPRQDSGVVYPTLAGSQPFQEFSGKCFRHVRCHNMFTGDGGDRQGAKNAGLVIVSWGPDGLSCTFDRLDAAYQAILDAGCIPFVELGFMPPALAMNAREAHEHPQPDDRDKELMFDPRTDIDDDGPAISMCPPRSYTAWGMLVRETVLHLQKRFGRDTIKDWPFELWNEPDLPLFWAGPMDEYVELYAITAKTIKAIDPALKVGGPSIAGSVDFLEYFLHQVDARDLPLDFISVHVKGGSPGRFPHPDLPHMLHTLEDYVSVMAKVPAFSSLDAPRRVPVLINEADPFLNCISGISENPVYTFRETTYYPCFVANLYVALVRYLRDGAPPWLAIHGAYSDNVHMMDERVPFGGYRNVVTWVPVDAGAATHPAVIVPPETGGMIDREALFSVHPDHPARAGPCVVIKKPVFHVYPLLQLLGEQEIVTSITGDVPDELTVLGSISSATRELAVLLTYFTPDLHASLPAVRVQVFAPVTVDVDGSRVSRARASTWRLDPGRYNAFQRWNEEWKARSPVNKEIVEALVAYNDLAPEPLAFTAGGDIDLVLEGQSLHVVVIGYE